ncbi:MAG: nucleotidyl transferase AbiEii/AbiGii toxin family protein [Thiotrichaceae bacterium]
MSKDIAASIRQRLLNLAKDKHENFDYVLRQYLIQRLLYRLSVSEYRDQFLLKGAMLFWVWNQDIHRPTRDIDLLGFGSNDKQHLAEVFQGVISLQEDDGLAFDAQNIHVQDIKEDAKYQGVRITGHANLDQARIPFQIDIGFGDAVTPDSENISLPSFLDLPAANIGAYPVYTVVAEKFQAMVELGIANSRLKDFFDLWMIASQFDLEGSILMDAISATFSQRETIIDLQGLTVFSNAFKIDQQKGTQWKAFLNKNQLQVAKSFPEIMTDLEAFLLPPYSCLASKLDFSLQWSPKSWYWK